MHIESGRHFPAFEATSLNNKFKQLWLAGIDTKLVFETHAGQAWANLNVQLGQAPGPLLHPQVHPPHHRKKESPSRQRRRAKRAAARNKSAEEATSKETENAEAEAVKASPTISENDEVGIDREEQVEILNDEFCPDDIYHPAESESIREMSFRCLQCRMLFLPTSHLEGSQIKDFNSCQKHIGVQKCSKCKIVLVGLAKIVCHRQVCQHPA